MSAPNLPNITPDISIDREDAINLLISSIAMEELGLSYILNAEGDKIQYVLGQLPGMVPPSPPTVSDILAISESVRQTLNTAMKNEMFLQSRLETIMSLVNAGNPAASAGNSETNEPAEPNEPSETTSSASPPFTGTHAFGANTTSQTITIEPSGVAIPLPENQVLNEIEANSAGTVFTVPATGDYLISYTVNAELATGDYIALTIDDVAFTAGVLMSVGGTTCYHNTVIVPLAAGSQIAIKIYGNTRTTHLLKGAGATLSIVMLGQEYETGKEG